MNLRFEEESEIRRIYNQSKFPDIELENIYNSIENSKTLEALIIKNLKSFEKLIEANIEFYFSQELIDVILDKYEEDIITAATDYDGTDPAIYDGTDPAIPPIVAYAVNYRDIHINILNNAISKVVKRMLY